MCRLDFGDRQIYQFLARHLQRAEKDQSHEEHSVKLVEFSKFAFSHDLIFYKYK